MKNFSLLVKQFVVSVVAFAVVLTFASMAGATSLWSDPTANAPGSNVDQPVNLGSGSQTKVGSFTALTLHTNGGVTIDPLSVAPSPATNNLYSLNGTLYWGANPIAAPNNYTGGYFVLSFDTWTGNLGGLSGANSKCLTEMNTYPWLGKNDATARGLLNSTHVKAFLCDGTSCNNPNASTVYTFAAANENFGGQTFTTNSSGAGPGDGMIWDGSMEFAYPNGYEYFTNRAAGSATLWGTTTGGSTTSCSNWSSTTGAPIYGSADTANSQRWNLYENPGVVCSSPLYLVCLVNP
jgi:hypothetical protein